MLSSTDCGQCSLSGRRQLFGRSIINILHDSSSKDLKWDSFWAQASLASLEMAFFGPLFYNWDVFSASTGGRNPFVVRSDRRVHGSFSRHPGVTGRDWASDVAAVARCFGPTGPFQTNQGCLPVGQKGRPRRNQSKEHSWKWEEQQGHLSSPKKGTPKPSTG